MYVVAANIGTMVATFSTPWIQDQSHHQYYIPFAVGASTLAAAIVLFLIGFRCYLHVTPRETVVSNYIPVVISAFQSRARYNRINRLADAEPVPSTALNASQSMTDEELSIRSEPRPSIFLDYAKLPLGKFHDRIVDDVKSLRGALIVFGLLIPYWIAYDQVKSIISSEL